MVHERGARFWQNALATCFFGFCALTVIGIFLFLLGHIIWNGYQAVSPSFITSMPSNAGRAGGIASILVSTILIVGVCMAVVLPLGLATAIVLAEFSQDHHRFGIFLRRSLDVLAGVPSIVFGLFGNVFFCQILGMGFSILAGGLTLACMVLPLLIRTTEEGLRAVPDSYRLGAAALGLSRTATLWHVLLPAAIPGLMVGLVLGLGRAAAETAALIFTSGYVDRMPNSLWDSGRSLTVHIYDLAMNVPGGNQNAYGSALVLVAALLVINYGAALIAAKWHPRRLKTL